MDSIKKKIAIIGGDNREKKLTGLLAQKGYQVNVLADEPFLEHERITYYTTVKSAIKGTDVVIAPVSGVDDRGFLKSSFVQKQVRLDENFFELFSTGTLFMIGVVNDYLKKYLMSKDIKHVELGSRDDFAILNAIPTAEGAIKIAIEETPFTLYDSNILVLGLGRVGKTLAWRLKLLGAEVYAATRSKKAIARGKDLGFNMIGYRNLSLLLPRMNIIFNTVPALVLNEELIKHVSSETLIIDLASSPGGTDFEAAKKRNITALLALGLPGKVAPESAGKILGEIVLAIIEKPAEYL